MLLILFCLVVFFFEEIESKISLLLYVVVLQEQTIFLVPGGLAEKILDGLLMLMQTLVLASEDLGLRLNSRLLSACKKKPIIFTSMIRTSAKGLF